MNYFNILQDCVKVEKRYLKFRKGFRRSINGLFGRKLFSAGDVLKVVYF